MKVQRNGVGGGGVGKIREYMNDGMASTINNKIENSIHKVLRADFQIFFIELEHCYVA